MKSNAKELKTALEKASFLDRTYRMVKADESALVNDPASHIAVPITSECLKLIKSTPSRSEYPWFSLVEDSGTQVVPYSTTVLGRK